jgi:hypothetical protein
VEPVDPGKTLDTVIAAVTEANRYRDPTPAEREAAVGGVGRLAIGDLPGATAVLGPLGFAVTDAIDPSTGRRFAMAVSELGELDDRRWGVYLVDLSAPLGLCVAVPHPRFDELCEVLALRLWRAVPGAMLAMATVHRKVNCAAADHAHNPGSVFQHLWTDLLGPRGVPQVQIHGFADTTADEEIAVSTGVAPVTATAVRIADGIAATGLHTTRSWIDDVDPDLRARTNVQGIAAGENGWTWVHIESRKSVRDAETAWQPAVDAVAAANPTSSAFERCAPSGTGLPQPTGAAAAAGTSRYFAREDHVHPGRAGGLRSVRVAGTSTVAVDASRGDYFRLVLDTDTTLAVPEHGVDGQQILVEVLASGAERALQLEPSILLCAGIATPVVIPADKRWFGRMVCLDAAGWILTSAATQA